MKIKINIVSISILLLLCSGFLSAQTKLAQTGFKFLSVGADARAAAMGEAVTAVENGSNSMFYNPAGMARQQRLVEVSFNSTSWIADINYLNASLSFAPSNGDFGVFGAYVSNVDYGDLKKTIRDLSEGGSYIDLGGYSPKAMVFGVGYAIALSDKFTVGANLKYAYLDFGTHYNGWKNKSFNEGTMAFDFGVIYKTGFKSLNFAMDVKNFSQELDYVEESFQLPMAFKIGLSMDLIDLTDINPDDHSFILSVDAHHPRDYKEQLLFGCEYTIWNTLSARVGYVTPTDEQGICAGIGVKQNVAGVEIGMDYSYSDFGVFDTVHRINVNIGY